MADTIDAKSEGTDMDTAAQSGGDDAVDAKGFRPADVTKMDMTQQAEGDANEQYMYNMNYPKRGLFVLINNKNFDQKKTGMTDRSGTDADASNLYQRFKELDFEIHMFNNQKAVDMVKIMEEASRYDHGSSDCFACAVLSHGDEGVVYGTDGIISIDQLVEPIKGHRCPSLIGKPKIFIIQACRGNQLDHGVAVEQSDAESETLQQKIYRIPSEADILYCYSTVPGFFSWRNSSKGSWFIQAMCRKLQQYGRTRDFLWILTRVSHEVAYEFESNASKEFMNKKKQVPQVVSMLTKDLIFKNKSKGTPV